MTATLPLPGYPVPPSFLTDEKEHRRKLAQSCQGLTQGKMNVNVKVTLRASQTTTIIMSPLIGGSSSIAVGHALTANGAAAIAAGIWISNILPGVGAVPGQATINHASNAATDQNIQFMILG